MNFERLIEQVEEDAEKGEFSKTDIQFLCIYTRKLLDKCPEIGANILCSIDYMKGTRYGDPIAKELEQQSEFLMNISSNTDLLR